MTDYNAGGHPDDHPGAGLPPAADPFTPMRQYGRSYQQPNLHAQANPYAAPAIPAPNGMPAAPMPMGAMPMGGAPYGVDMATGLPYSDKTKSTAGLLQLFLGGFGVGRFYLGHVGIGIAQLLLTLIGIVTSVIGVGLLLIMGVGIWALVDAIMMFTGSVKDSEHRVLR